MRHRGLSWVDVFSVRIIPIVGVALLAVGGSSLFLQTANAISYTSIGQVVSENFDSLPIGPPFNASLQTTIPWTDDSTSTATQTSLPGWYLWHATTQTEGGANGHQRIRIGAGNSGTGSFYSFGSNATFSGVGPESDRALGSVTSTTVNGQNFALRLTNNSGGDLGQFTLSYTGEQWRDGGAAIPNAHTMSFGYAVTPSDMPPANISALSVTGVPNLNFTSPTFSNTGGGVQLDGNDTPNRTLRSTTVGGFLWKQGEDLWLRWTDPENPGNDHGLSIDDVTFTAAAPAEVNSQQTGLASLGTTWSDGQAPGIGKGYHVINGHVVTLDGPFVGSKLSVENGTVDINASGSNQQFGAMTIEANGNLTESVAGDISIGADTTSSLRINRDVAFNLDANSTFRLKATLSGTGNLAFNEASPGSSANAEVYLDAASGSVATGMMGTVKFNAGKQLNVTENASLNLVEMNSTQAGGNILNYGPKAATTITRLTFNQPGTLIHSTNNPSGTPGQRLTSLTALVANAAVTVDMSQTLPIEERRYLVGVFQGNGNVTVKGTPADPTDPNAGGPPAEGITLNEFEVGAQTTNPAISSFESYSGTISTQDYINVEIRRNLPSAKFVVNDKGRLETGVQVIPLPADHNGTTLGEVVVNSGGVLEVGFEQANAVAGTFVEGHHINKLRLASGAGKNGSLTLNSGATLRMQVNGTGPTDFDSIVANGNINLGGTLEVLLNPVSCTGQGPCGANVNGSFSPQLGDTFDFISVGPPLGDYDGNGSVGSSDYDLWQATFGSTVAIGSSADGNLNGVVDAADYSIWRNSPAATTGSIIGNFTNAANVVAIGDPNVIFEVIKNGSNTLAQLRVKSVTGGAGNGSAVPEPTALLLAGIGMTWFALVRRRIDR